ncbi:MAG: hypothetical protein P4M00_18240 [Azospirillaceae bacterium]|nr:hypothetical protein [Azospirillaceae bacterium]
MRIYDFRPTMVAAIALSAAVTTPARADGGQVSNQQVLREIAALKAQMQSIQALQARIQQLETQIKVNSDNASAAKATADLARQDAAAATTASADAAAVMGKLRKGQLQIGHTNIGFSGWVEASMSRRQHNELAGPSSTSLNTPFPNQAQWHDNEFRAGPPQTRFGLTTTSDVSDDLIFKSKIEFDTLSGSNAAGTANGGSWTPRLRHAWGEVDDLKTGWHAVLGQAYSLTIPNGNGINADGSPSPNLGWKMLPGSEATSSPDDGALAGLGATRNMQFRVVKEVATNAAVALSLENNEVSWGGDKGTSINKPIVNNSSYNATTAFNSLGTIPDIVAKVAYDPTPDYHFESWGILRRYKDSNTGIAGLPDAGSVFSGGFGVNTFIKVIPGVLDVQNGIGYGSIGQQIDGLIPDVTYSSTGKPVPIMDRYAFANIVGHVTPDLDLYLQAGIEQGSKAGVSGNTAATAYGYGNPYGAGGGNSGCMVLGGTCSQDARTYWNVTPTAIWRVYNGSFGHLDFLPQLQYVNKTLFKDQFGRAPSASNWAVDMAFRYWPF